MTTTLADMHGIERECAQCRMTYRYAPAPTFVCYACGIKQAFEVLPAAPSIFAQQSAGSTGQGLLSQQMINDDLPPQIDLRAVHATLNQMSGDGLRQLADRLTIMQIVGHANMTRSVEPELFARVRQALAGAGMKF